MTRPRGLPRIPHTRDSSDPNGMISNLSADPDGMISNLSADPNGMISNLSGPMCIPRLKPVCARARSCFVGWDISGACPLRTRFSLGGIYLYDTALAQRIYEVYHRRGTEDTPIDDLDPDLSLIWGMFVMTRERESGVNHPSTKNARPGRGAA